MSNFIEIRPVGAEFYVEGGPDGQTDMTKLIVAFHNFSNASKNPQPFLRLLTHYSRLSYHLPQATLYRVSQEERAKLREGVPYVKLYRYNPKRLYPKLNGYGDNGQRSLKL